MAGTARRVAVGTIVFIAIVVLALALWKLKLVIALVFFGFIIAAAMRPGVEWLRRHMIPRSAGVLVHYLALLGLIALFLWFVVPRASHQVSSALGSLPQTRAQLGHQAQSATGIKHDILVAVQKRLKHLPRAGSLVHPALSATKTAFEVLIGIFFVFAVGAYWIFERDRAVDVVASFVERPKRKRLRDTWDLIDAKLGAFVRGQLLLISFVATLLSVLFWAIGLPYWILIGSFAGIVEIVPVIGPLAAGALAIGVGFTSSWHTALFAGLCVLGVRMLEDYVVTPRVLGHAVGLSPLLVLMSVSATGILLGGFYVLFAIPIAAVLVTLVDVILRDVDPAGEDVPTVLFPAKEVES